MSVELPKTSRPAPKNAANVSLILEDEIATGVLPPGTRLEEQMLSERFGLSRTPIREALRLLSAMDLVEIRPNRGAVVSAPDLNRLLEMFETMAEMEGMCARLSSRRMTKNEQNELDRQHQACGDAIIKEDAQRYHVENARFHELLYQGTHNTFLCEQLHKLRRRLQVYRRLQLGLPGRMSDSFEEHSAIVKAILARNDRAAEKAAHDHITVQGDRFSDWIATLRASNVFAES